MSSVLRVLGDPSRNRSDYRQPSWVGIERTPDRCLPITPTNPANTASDLTWSVSTADCCMGPLMTEVVAMMPVLLICNACHYLRFGNFLLFAYS
jgi:hypothetical protein